MPNITSFKRMPTLQQFYVGLYPVLLAVQGISSRTLRMLLRTTWIYWIRKSEILNGLKIDQLGFTSLVENESKLTSWLWRYTLSQTELPLSMQQNQPQNEPNSTSETQFNESNIISNVTTLRTVIEHEDYKPGYEVSFVIPKNMLWIQVSKLVYA